ncbi:MAG: N-6 DNA methylase, partial [Alphaproteobacteria bacterium]|nr:N-6 DNA methylase [Alphaproteobacteria bacterium]
MAVVARDVLSHAGGYGLGPTSEGIRAGPPAESGKRTVYVKLANRDANGEFLRWDNVAAAMTDGWCGHTEIFGGEVDIRIGIQSATDPTRTRWARLADADPEASSEHAVRAMRQAGDSIVPPRPIYASDGGGDVESLYVVQPLNGLVGREIDRAFASAAPLADHALRAAHSRRHLLRHMIDALQRPLARLNRARVAVDVEQAALFDAIVERAAPMCGLLHVVVQESKREFDPAAERLREIARVAGPLLGRLANKGALDDTQILDLRHRLGQLADALEPLGIGFPDAGRRVRDEYRAVGVVPALPPTLERLLPVQPAAPGYSPDIDRALDDAHGFVADADAGLLHSVAPDGVARATVFTDADGRKAVYALAEHNPEMRTYFDAITNRIVVASNNVDELPYMFADDIPDHIERAIATNDLRYETPIYVETHALVPRTPETQPIHVDDVVIDRVMFEIDAGRVRRLSADERDLLADKAQFSLIDVTGAECEAARLSAVAIARLDAAVRVAPMSPAMAYKLAIAAFEPAEHAGDEAYGPYHAHRSTSFDDGDILAMNVWHAPMTGAAAREAVAQAALSLAGADPLREAEPGQVESAIAAPARAAIASLAPNLAAWRREIVRNWLESEIKALAEEMDRFDAAPAKWPAPSLENARNDTSQHAPSSAGPSVASQTPSPRSPVVESVAADPFGLSFYGHTPDDMPRLSAGVALSPVAQPLIAAIDDLDTDLVRAGAGGDGSQTIGAALQSFAEIARRTREDIVWTILSQSRTGAGPAIAERFNVAVNEALGAVEFGDRLVLRAALGDLCDALNAAGFAARFERAAPDSAPLELMLVRWLGLDKPPVDSADRDLVEMKAMLCADDTMTDAARLSRSVRHYAFNPDSDLCIWNADELDAASHGGVWETSPGGPWDDLDALAARYAPEGGVAYMTVAGWHDEDVYPIGPFDDPEPVSSTLELRHPAGLPAGTPRAVWLDYRRGYQIRASAAANIAEGRGADRLLWDDIERVIATLAGLELAARTALPAPGATRQIVRWMIDPDERDDALGAVARVAGPGVSADLRGALAAVQRLGTGSIVETSDGARTNAISASLRAAGERLAKAVAAPLAAWPRASVEASASNAAKSWARATPYWLSSIEPVRYARPTIEKPAFAEKTLAADFGWNWSAGAPVAARVRVTDGGYLQAVVDASPAEIADAIANRRLLETAAALASDGLDGARVRDAQDQWWIVEDAALTPSGIAAYALTSGAAAGYVLRRARAEEALECARAETAYELGALRAAADDILGSRDARTLRDSALRAIHLVRSGTAALWRLAAGAGRSGVRERWAAAFAIARDAERRETRAPLDHGRATTRAALAAAPATAPEGICARVALLAQGDRTDAATLAAVDAFVWIDLAARTAGKFPEFAGDAAIWAIEGATPFAGDEAARARRLDLVAAHADGACVEIEPGLFGSPLEALRRELQPALVETIARARADTARDAAENAAIYALRGGSAAPLFAPSADILALDDPFDHLADGPDVARSDDVYVVCRPDGSPFVEHKPWGTGVVLRESMESAKAALRRARARIVIDGREPDWSNPAHVAASWIEATGGDKPAARQIIARDSQAAALLDAGAPLPAIETPDSGAFLKRLKLPDGVWTDLGPQMPPPAGGWSFAELRDLSAAERFEMKDGFDGWKVVDGFDGAKRRTAFEYVAWDSAKIGRALEHAETLAFSAGAGEAVSPLPEAPGAVVWVHCADEAASVRVDLQALVQSGARGMPWRRLSHSTQWPHAAIYRFADVAHAREFERALTEDREVISQIGGGFAPLVAEDDERSRVVTALEQLARWEAVDGFDAAIERLRASDGPAPDYRTAERARAWLQDYFGNFGAQDGLGRWLAAAETLSPGFADDYLRWSDADASNRPPETAQARAKLFAIARERLAAAGLPPLEVEQVVARARQDAADEIATFLDTDDKGDVRAALYEGLLGQSVDEPPQPGDGEPEIAADAVDPFSLGLTPIEPMRDPPPAERADVAIVLACGSPNPVSPSLSLLRDIADASRVRAAFFVAAREGMRTGDTLLRFALRDFADPTPAFTDDARATEALGEEQAWRDAIGKPICHPGATAYRATRAAQILKASGAASVIILADAQGLEQLGLDIGNQTEPKLERLLDPSQCAIVIAADALDAGRSRVPAVAAAAFVARHPNAAARNPSAYAVAELRASVADTHRHVLRDLGRESRSVDDLYPPVIQAQDQETIRRPNRGPQGEAALRAVAERLNALADNLGDEKARGALRSLAGTIAAPPSARRRRPDLLSLRARVGGPLDLDNERALRRGDTREALAGAFLRALRDPRAARTLRAAADVGYAAAWACRLLNAADVANDAGTIIVRDRGGVRAAVDAAIRANAVREDWKRLSGETEGAQASDDGLRFKAAAGQPAIAKGSLKQRERSSIGNPAGVEIAKILRGVAPHSDTRETFRAWIEALTVALGGELQGRASKSQASDIARRKRAIADIVKAAAGRTADRASVERVRAAFVEMTRIAASASRAGDPDLIGKLFMGLDWGNDYRGQFFTPPDLARLTAHMSIGQHLEDRTAPAPGERPFFHVMEPACGAGAMLVMAKEVIDARGEALDWLADGVELDHLTAKMAFVQCALAAVPARIWRGDAIGDPREWKCVGVTEPARRMMAKHTGWLEKVARREADFHPASMRPDAFLANPPFGTKVSPREIAWSAGAADQPRARMKPLIRASVQLLQYTRDPSDRTFGAELLVDGARQSYSGFDDLDAVKTRLGEQYPGLRFSAGALDEPLVGAAAGLKSPRAGITQRKRQPERSLEAQIVRDALDQVAVAGSAAIVVPPGVLFRRDQRALRDALLTSGSLRAVVDLPPGLFATTGVGVALLVLQAPDGRKRPIVFADIAAELSALRRANRPDISKLPETLKDALAGRRDVPGITGRARNAEIRRDEDLNLTPRRYVSARAQEEESRDIPALMADLAKLDREVRESSARVEELLAGLFPTLRDTVASAQVKEDVSLSVSAGAPNPPQRTPIGVDYTGVDFGASESRAPLRALDAACAYLARIAPFMRIAEHDVICDSANLPIPSHAVFDVERPVIPARPVGFVAGFQRDTADFESGTGLLEAAAQTGFVGLFYSGRLSIDDMVALSDNAAVDWSDFSNVQSDNFEIWQLARFAGRYAAWAVDQGSSGTLTRGAAGNEEPRNGNRNGRDQTGNSGIDRQGDRDAAPGSPEYLSPEVRALFQAIHNGAKANAFDDPSLSNRRLGRHGYEPDRYAWSAGNPSAAIGEPKPVRPKPGQTQARPLDIDALIGTLQGCAPWLPPMRAQRTGPDSLEVAIGASNFEVTVQDPRLITHRAGPDREVQVYGLWLERLAAQAAGRLALPDIASAIAAQGFDPGEPDPAGLRHIRAGEAILTAGPEREFARHARGKPHPNAAEGPSRGSIR